MEALGIVGAGNIGQALARLLAPAFRIRIASRSRAPEGAAFAGSGAVACRLGELVRASDCVLLAVPDRAVESVAVKLAASAPRVVLQTCGGLGPTDLGPLPGLGVPCATFHPLQTVPTREDGVRVLPGSVFGVCGEGEARAWCERLAGALEGTTVRIEESHLALYHASAVVAANFAVALVDASRCLLEAAGADRREIARALGSLMEAGLRNAHTMGAERALTGPVARGDAATVRRHLDAMRDQHRPLRDLYRELTRYLLGLAARGGLAPDDVAAMRRALDVER